MNATSPLHIVLLTPPGRGAVATVRVEGPGASQRVDAHFQAASGRPVADLPFDRLAFGRFHLGEEVHDEVIVRRPEENAVEVHCHGGPAVVERLIAVLSAEGGRRISSDDWLKSIHPSPIVAAAHAALGRATTLRAASILLDQYHGALDRALKTIVEHLHRADTLAATQAIEQLLDIAPCGRHLAHPWRVVLAGRPNVGKSSLINALVGYERAIVHAAPGTTRDLVTARTALDGWPVEFCDTAGLRTTDHPIEQQGIGLAERQLASASLVLLVFDLTQPWCQEDTQLANRFPNALRVFNKIDVAQAEPASALAGYSISATERFGIDELIRAISDRLVSSPPKSGQPVPFLDEQVEVLQKAADDLRQGNVEGAIDWIRRLLTG